MYARSTRPRSGLAHRFQFLLDRADHVFERFGEGRHAIILQLLHYRWDVDTGIAECGKRLRCVCQSIDQCWLRRTMIHERSDGRWRHRIDRFGSNQRFDIQQIREGRILGTGRGPQQALWMGTLRPQRGKALGRINILVRAIGRLRVGDRGLALKCTKFVLLSGIGRRFDLLIELRIRLPNRSGLRRYWQPTRPDRVLRRSWRDPQDH